MKRQNNQDKWKELRKKHREHLKKLGPIRQQVDKFLITKPLSEYENPPLHDSKEMKKAYNALREWEKKEIEITAEYSKF